MIARWLPWKFLIKHAARRFGIIDPINLVARIRRFSQPSEVQEPIELLRAGIIFHARGLINTKAIQYNMDWVWPVWVEKQFNPADLSFIPRGFSFSHVNLTHRNWTAVGHPDLPLYPIMDPHGLVTPLYDGWSIDCWMITASGRKLIPSRLKQTRQSIHFDPNPRIQNLSESENLLLNTTLEMEVVNGAGRAVITAEGKSDEAGWIVFVLRPYNPEGIQFIEAIELQDSPAPLWLVNRHTRVRMDQEPDKTLFSDYEEGDVLEKWDLPQTVRHVRCSVGMATSAAFFKIPENNERRVSLKVDLAEDIQSKTLRRLKPIRTWEQRLDGLAELSVPDRKVQFLYDTAVRTLLMLSADDPVPGPYTYRRFWFRDACLMLNAMMAVNMMERSRNRMDRFPARQKYSGYFQSQEGEWDSNGQVIWIMDRYFRLSGGNPPEAWLDAIFKGAEWIEKKRTRKRPGVRHGGLLPAGFSAEHLGPNDYYYWDDFWGLIGLKAAAELAGRYRSTDLSRKLSNYYRDFSNCIFHSIAAIPESRSRNGIPASPYRRMDAGAIGSLVADYPLQITPAGDSRIMNTIRFLMENSFHDGAFFQDMIHSGINAYLTLDIAQSMLRAGDERFEALIEKVADLASPTGQWPEAIHPNTLGGCMGDGQHGWAAAEWAIMVRNLFVREEADTLIIGSGIFEKWLQNGDRVSFGPTPTPYGLVSVSITPGQDSLQVELAGRWRDGAPEVQVRIPGYAPKTIDKGAEYTHLKIEVDKH